MAERGRIVKPSVERAAVELSPLFDNYSQQVMKPEAHPMLRTRERVENDVIFNPTSGANADRHLRKQAQNSQHAQLRSSRVTAEIVRGLLAGRIDHELRPSAQLLMSELSAFLSARELELLRSSLLLSRPQELGRNIQGVITALLRDCFKDLELIASMDRTSGASKIPELPLRPDLFAGDDSSSQARILGTLRDLALQLATFLERSESDGLEDLHDLLIECQSQLQSRAAHLRISSMQLQTGHVFLSQVATAIFFEKLDLIAHDYVASGTDFSMVSGKVWASRYSRGDYLHFLFDNVDQLIAANPWLFEDQQVSESAERLKNLQQQVAARTSDEDRVVDDRTVAHAKPLESLLLELRAMFGIGLNALVREEGEIAVRFFERVLTITADALEHPERPSSDLSNRLTRLRAQAYFCWMEAEICDSAKRYRTVPEKERESLGVSLFFKKSLSIRRLGRRAKYELELLGLSGLAVDIEGRSHASLEGLSAWTEEICAQEESYMLAELARACGQTEEAHRLYCAHMALSLGFEAWESEKFLTLDGNVRIDSRSGAQVASGWRALDVPSYSSLMLTEVSERVKHLTLTRRERFFGLIPVLVSLALDFEDFDKGFGFAVAHRHLAESILPVVASNPTVELLLGLIDAEVRSRFGLVRSSKSVQHAALSVLGALRGKERKGYFREIDRKRELRLAQSVDDLSKVGALRELSDYRETLLLKEGVFGQFSSQEIRMLSAEARETGKKAYARDLSNLALLRIDQTLAPSDEELKIFLEMSPQSSAESHREDPDQYLSRLHTESRCFAGVQMLLDASLTSAFVHDEKTSRSLLQEIVNRYSVLFPGLKSIVENILATQSLEEFRRRVEFAIRTLEDEALSTELSLMGAGTGAALGFFLSEGEGSGLAKFFDRVAVIADVSRRRVVPGRCHALEKYTIAHRWSRLQRRLASCVVALHHGLNARTRTLQARNA